MSTNNTGVDPRLEGFIASAAHLGEIAHRAKADLDLAVRKAGEAEGVAKQRATALAREVNGFKTPLFTGLVGVAQAFAQIYNDPTTQSALDAAAVAAKSFMASATGSTDASAKGGRSAGYVKTITLGNNATRVVDALQDRLDYWNGVLDSATEIEDAKKRAESIKLAKRYTVACGLAPLADGSWPENNKGEKQKPKFNGRPAVMVNEISIPYGRATPRDAQLAAFVTMYDMHGEGMLAPEVVDAFLDNGGKYVDPNEDSPTAIASQALEKINALLVAGGDISGDRASLSLMVAVLGRIAKEGLRDSVVSESPAESVDATPTEPDETTAAHEAQNIASGSDSEVTQESVVEGEGVAFGAPTPGTNRSRRRNKG